MRSQRFAALRFLAVGGIFGLVALLTVGCTTGVTGQARPLGAPGATSTPKSTEVPPYNPIDNGMAFHDHPLDQPMPLPDRTQPGACDWLESALEDLRPIGVTRTGQASSGCQFALGENKTLQMEGNWPYDAMTEPTDFIEPVRIADLRGRVYSFVSTDIDAICAVELDVRAYVSLKVSVWDREPADRPGSQEDRRQHCDTAKQAIEILAKKFVPLAGGTPWPGTLQKPPDNALRGTQACEAVTDSDVYFAGTVDKDPAAEPTDFGNSCTYVSQFSTIKALVTSGTNGLSDLPQQVPGVERRQHVFGVLPAATEQAADRCFISVQLDNGQVLSVGYINPDDKPTPFSCFTVQVVLGVSLLHLGD